MHGIKALVIETCRAGEYGKMREVFGTSAADFVKSVLSLPFVAKWRSLGNFHHFGIRVNPENSLCIQLLATERSGAITVIAIFENATHKSELLTWFCRVK